MELEKFLQYLKEHYIYECVINLKYKYEWETEFTFERLYICYYEEFDDFEYSNDWDEGQEIALVDSFIPLDDIYDEVFISTEDI